MINEVRGGGQCWDVKWLPIFWIRVTSRTKTKGLKDKVWSFGFNM